MESGDAGKHGRQRFAMSRLVPRPLVTLGSPNRRRCLTTSTSSALRFISSWALTTSDGIILIDTLYTYNSEEEIIGGLKKLGLDLNRVHGPAKAPKY